MGFAFLSFIPWPNSEYILFTYSPIFAAGVSLVGLYKNKSLFNWIFPIFFFALTAYKFGLVISLLLILSGLAILYCRLDISILAFLGNISYSLYLIHPLLSFVFYRANIKLNLHLEQNPLVWLQLQTLIAIGVAYCLYTLIDKPSLAFSKRIIYQTGNGNS
jgi:peptidoglycan/LPS O-acetylase OafA/YrhL